MLRSYGLPNRPLYVRIESMPSATTPKQIATVLIVDHDSSARERLCSSFEKAGYRALGAEDAASALRLLHQDPADLIVLDLEMPGVDGLALCRLLRAQPATSQLPVIALSAHDEDSQKVEAFAAGADDYIPKTSSSGEIVSRSASHLRAARREWALIGSNRELRFLADLGRGLLRALEPEQLVRRVAGATYEGTSAVLCAAFVKLNEQSDAACVFDREGSAEDSSLLPVDRLKTWLASSAAPLLITDKGSFFLRDDGHQSEYTSPLGFGGRTQGALIVAF